MARRDGRAEEPADVPEQRRTVVEPTLVPHDEHLGTLQMGQEALMHVLEQEHPPKGGIGVASCSSLFISRLNRVSY